MYSIGEGEDVLRGLAEGDTSAENGKLPLRAITALVTMSS